MQVKTRPEILKNKPVLSFKNLIQEDIKYDQTEIVELLFDSGIFDTEFIINYDYILYPKVKQNIKQWYLVSPRLAGALIGIGAFVYWHRDRNDKHSSSKSYFWGREEKGKVEDLLEDDILINAFMKMNFYKNSEMQTS